MTYECLFLESNVLNGGSGRVKNFEYYKIMLLQSIFDCYIIMSKERYLSNEKHEKEAYISILILNLLVA